MVTTLGKVEVDVPAPPPMVKPAPRVSALPGVGAGLGVGVLSTPAGLLRLALGLASRVVPRGELARLFRRDTGSR